MDKLKELAEYLYKISINPKVRRGIRYTAESDYMNKAGKININTKNYNAKLTYYFTAITQFVFSILLIAIYFLYTWFSVYGTDFGILCIIKIMTIVLFSYICIINIQHYLFGLKTGEFFIATSNGIGENYNYKGYTHLHINTTFTFASLLALLLIYLLRDEEIFIFVTSITEDKELLKIILFITENNKLFICTIYIAVIVIVIITICNLINIKLTGKDFVTVDINDKIIIDFKNGLGQRIFNLYDELYILNILKIKFDNNILIHTLEPSNREIFNKDAIAKLTIGSTTLKYNSQYNKWETQPLQTSASNSKP